MFANRKNDYTSQLPDFKDVVEGDGETVGQGDGAGGGGDFSDVAGELEDRAAGLDGIGDKISDMDKWLI